MVQQSFDPRASPLTSSGAQHRAIAREAVRRSRVLLKNNDSALPLNSDMRFCSSVQLLTVALSNRWVVCDLARHRDNNSDFPGSTSFKQALTVLAQVVAPSNIRFQVTIKPYLMP